MCQCKNIFLNVISCYTFPTGPPNDVSEITADLRVAVGIIRIILSISLAEIKFCSSRKKYCDLDQMLKISDTWLYKSSAFEILLRSQ